MWTIHMMDGKTTSFTQGSKNQPAAGNEPFDGSTDQPLRYTLGSLVQHHRTAGQFDQCPPNLAEQNVGNPRVEIFLIWVCLKIVYP